MREEALRSARQAAYSAVCPPLNRAERRTAKGRMLVAMAEAAALRAEVEFLRREMTPNMEFRPGLEAKPKGIAPGTQG